MPKPLWIYLTALLHFTKVSACSTIAEVFPKASHDCLTRMLNGDWSGQPLLDWALRLLFLVVGGYLIVDDTVVENPPPYSGPVCQDQKYEKISSIRFYSIVNLSPLTSSHDFH